jgi:hypothetical protein
MHSKIVAIAAMAALAEQASAYNHNRHSHQMAKRAMETVFETVWETVYVTEGQEPGPTEPAVDPVNPVITSTSVVVVPTTTEAPTTQPPPPPPPPATTMVTSVAPEPVEPPVENKPEEPPVENKPEEPPVENNPVDPQPEEPVETQPEEPVETQPEEPVETQPEEPEPSSPSAGLPSKRGMAYNVADLANSYHNTCQGCNWAYNWGSSSGNLDSSVSFVPMCWGEKAFGHWQQDAETALSNGAKALLSFNEPDHVDQANMSPSDAARMHKEQMDPFAGRAKIGSPAVTNGGGEMGITWLKNFMEACDAQGGCAIDFCVVHWYSEAQYADTLLDHIKQAHEVCGGRPVWLTEFAPLGDDNQINDFMTNMIPKLDAIDYLEAYSYFWVDNALMRDSSITSFGQIYATI